MKRDYSVLTWSDKGEQGAQWTHGTQTHPTLHSEAFHPTAEPAVGRYLAKWSALHKLNSLKLACTYVQNPVRT
jgi:hypothetical protein